MKEIYQSLEDITGGAPGLGGAIAGAITGAAGGYAATSGSTVGAVCGAVAGSAAGSLGASQGGQATFGAAAGVGCVNGSASSSSTSGCAGSCTAANAEACAAAAASDGGGGGGGGKVICTELCRNGVIAHEVWMADIRYSRQNFSEQTMRGYHLWGIPYVKLMRKYPSLAKLAEHPTRWFAEDIAYRMGVLTKPNFKGWVLREVFFRPICFGIGLFAKARDWKSLWRDGVTPAGVRS